MTNVHHRSFAPTPTNFRRATVLALAMGLSNPAAAQLCAAPATATLAPPAATWLRGRSELLRAPARVATDAAGNSYVTDASGGRVIVRDRWGRLVAVRLGLRAPSGIALSANGTAYVVETAARRVSIFGPGWLAAGTLGTGDGELQLPTDVAVDPASGAVFVSDGGANRILVYGPDGLPRFAFGAPGPLPGQLRFPAGLHFTRGGELLVADQGNRRVQAFDAQGRLLRCFPVLATRIFGLASDGAGRIYVSDAFQGRLEVRDPLGAWLGTLGRWGDGAGGLRTPTGVAVDPFDRLLVAAGNGGSVELFGLDAFQDPRVLQATVALSADSLAAAPAGAVVAATIELPGTTAAEIAPATLAANGVPVDPDFAVVADADLDGVPDLRVRFDAAALRATLDGDPAWLVLTGELRDGTPLEGAAALHLTIAGGSR
jgi:DNA-binding beta-propeller fold protein YncE